MRRRATSGRSGSARPARSIGGRHRTGPVRLGRRRPVRAVLDPDLRGRGRALVVLADGWHCCRARVRWPTARDCLRGANAPAGRPRVSASAGPAQPRDPPARLHGRALATGRDPAPPAWPGPRSGRARRTERARLVLSSQRRTRPADHLQRAVAQFGRAPVSKTGGWGFESLLPCSPDSVRRSHT